MKQAVTYVGQDVSLAPEDQRDSRYVKRAYERGDEIHLLALYATSDHMLHAQGKAIIQQTLNECGEVGRKILKASLSSSKWDRIKRQPWGHDVSHTEYSMRLRRLIAEPEVAGWLCISP